MLMRELISYMLSVLTILCVVVLVATTAQAQVNTSTDQAPQGLSEELLAPLAPSAAATGQEAPPQASFPIPLKDLRAEHGPLRLETAEAEASIFYPVSPRFLLEEALLELDFTNSTALLQERSQLIVRNNERIIAQFPLEGDNPSKLARIRIPSNTFEAGFNTLSFGVSQHYTDQCEDPTAPELWTEVDTTRSRLVLEGRLDTEIPHLSELNDLFYPSIGAKTAFNMMVGVGTLTDNHLGWGNEIAQALGLRFDYIVPELISMQASPRRAAAPQGIDRQRLFNLDNPGGNNVVLYGTRRELAPFLPNAIADEISGAFVGIYEMPGNPGAFALILSGTTPEEVSLAVNSFTHTNFPYIDAPSMIVNTITPPSTRGGDRLSSVVADTMYTFFDLGLPTTELNFTDRPVASLSFDLPPDFYVKESDNVELSLNLAYGAGLREDAVLNLTVNGVFERAIPLDDPRGSLLRDYVLTIPARTFVAGRNTISFDPVWVSKEAGECLPFQTENLVLTVYEESEISFPPAESYVHQPDLDLFQRTGFPYTKDAFGGDLALLVGATDHATVSAAFLLSAKLAQVSGDVLDEMAVGFQLPETAADRHIISVGAAGSLDPAILENAPLDLGTALRLPYQDTNQRGPRLADPWEDFNAAYELARQKEQDRDNGNRPRSFAMEKQGSLGDNTLLFAYRSPLGSGTRTMSVLTAQSPAALLTGARRLTDAEIWGQLTGDVAVWRPQSEFVFTQRASAPFFMGDVKAMSFLRFHLARAPFWWVFAAFVLVGALALLIHRMVTARVDAMDRGA